MAENVNQKQNVYWRFRLSGMMRRFAQFQIDALTMAFEESNHLTREKKAELANITGLDVEQITSWFNRKRERQRNQEARRASQGRNDELLRALQESAEREAELLHELEECRRREADLRDEIRELRQQLFDSDIDPVLGFVDGEL